MRMIYGFTWWMCVQLVAWSLIALNVPGLALGAQGENPEDIYSAFDPNGTIAGWTGEDEPFTSGSPIRAGYDMWDTIQIVVASVPYILAQWGAHEVIVWIGSAVWMMGWGWFIWGFISGRIFQ